LTLAIFGTEQKIIHEQAVKPCSLRTAQQYLEQLLSLIPLDWQLDTLQLSSLSAQKPSNRAILRLITKTEKRDYESAKKFLDKTQKRHSALADKRMNDASLL
jgi:hypothetical protein